MVMPPGTEKSYRISTLWVAGLDAFGSRIVARLRELFDIGARSAVGQMVHTGSAVGSVVVPSCSFI